MAFIANGRLNISQIDKSKIIEGKNGAQWINITISANDEPDQYDNDISITIARSEEERKKDSPTFTKAVYLANAKTTWSNGVAQKSIKKDRPQEPTEDVLPF
jgi:hypothetical protein